VLLNIDLGELREESETLYGYANLANIACGGHAGDDTSMRRAVLRCLAHRTLVGAHPSYPDRDGFGRRAVAMSPDALRTSIGKQCARLAVIARDLGGAVLFVKAHGVLYHDAGREPAVADAVVGGAMDALGSGVTLIGPPRAALASAAARVHLGYAREGFADRATHADGTLVSRDEPGALLVDPAVCAEHARAIVLRGDADTVCVHGDTAGAVHIARAVRAALDTLVEA
jgi:UPF0271 protein